MAPIRGHLIRSIENKNYFDSIQFLIIVQSLEGYHSRFCKKLKVPKGESELKHMLWNILQIFQEINKISTLNLNVDEVVDSRNYYSHFYVKTKDTILDGIELAELTIKLRLLLICCVLKLVGLRNSKINELINKINLQL